MQKGAPFGGRNLMAVAKQTRALFALHNLPIEADKTPMREKFARNCHQIIMTSGLRQKSDRRGSYDNCHRNTLTRPPQTGENKRTGCSPVNDSGYRIHGLPGLAIFLWQMNS